MTQPHEHLAEDAMPDLTPEELKAAQDAMADEIITKILSEPKWTRIGRAGSYAVWELMENGERIYQVSDGERPRSNGGYPVLDSLLSLKGLSRADFILWG